MGCSCDWQRTRFTMDEVCAKAVRAAFFKLFKDGLIYRGKRLVNWDPATQTVLADDEVEHETIQGHFWYMKYPLVEPVDIDGQRIEHVTVATTRPETMLGDTAVAMNPADPRAKYLVGKRSACRSLAESFRSSPMSTWCCPIPRARTRRPGSPPAS